MSHTWQIGLGICIHGTFTHNKHHHQIPIRYSAFWSQNFRIQDKGNYLRHYKEFQTNKVGKTYISIEKNSIKGMGEATYKLDSWTPMRMKDVLYVPGLKKNLLSISSLDKKGFRVSFVDGEVLMWSKGKTIEDTVVIGIEEGGLYKLKGHSDVALTHSIEIPCELWHRRLAHINYKALPYVSKVVTSLP